MPIKEFACTECSHEHEELVKVDVRSATCPECGANSIQEIRTAPKIDWGAMGAQKNVSPEFIDRFERVHKAEAAKELQQELKDQS